jgi:SAM-dependent methyltransferase
MVTRTARRGATLLPRLGITPWVGDVLLEALDEAVTAAARRTDEVAVLDAGCGRRTPFRHLRARIARIVGVDIHEPVTASEHLDSFAVVDLCGPGDAIADASFDIILSNFTMEHFRDPSAAVANFRRWLKPGGSLVVTTVNRRHPFVRAYLGMPDRVRRVLQPWIKVSAADAHPLVGACNDTGCIRATLEAAGFEAVRIRSVGNLAHAWRRRIPSFLLGVVGDLLAQPFPDRRSTFVVTARKAA